MTDTAETLAQQLGAITTQIPEPIAARIDAANAATVASGATGLAVGANAPDFTLPNAEGAPVHLGSLLADGLVVVSFYRGAWCPFCNLELRALQAHLEEISALGATVVAISPQAPDVNLEAADEGELGFDVLSDADQSVSDAYRLRYDLDGESRDLAENVFGLDLAAENADGTWRLAVPGTYVIDTAGTIRGAHTDADYRTRMDPADIVAALTEIGASA